MTIIFLAGPFRGDGSREAKMANVKVAREHARLFIEREIPFYSPHLNLDQELIDYELDRSKFAISVNHNFLSKCDALAVLPGWEKSTGTKEEIEISKTRGIPVFYLQEPTSIDTILKWLQK